jgi:cellulose biosynthesis protein BcsQ
MSVRAWEESVAQGAPSTSGGEPGIVYTFYSYKGGVGRSMALANVGVLLALSPTVNGRPPRVLLVDWDLEAPGLEIYFQRTNKVTLRGDPLTMPGVLDMLERLSEGRPLPWQNCLLRASFGDTSIDIISSGSKTTSIGDQKDYRRRVQQLDWNNLFSTYDVGNYFDEIRRQWIENYDYILIDSRTGITDIGDICTVLLADALVLGFVSNFQNVEGVVNIVERARVARDRLPIDRSRLIAVPVPMRDEVYTEYDKSTEWKAIYAAKLGHLYADWLPKNIKPSDALSKLFIPYVPKWSFGECIPVLEQT